jgi:DNA-binding GntR family transcriptional regulator
MRIYTPLDETSFDIERRSYAAHIRIIEALRSRDPVRSEEEMRQQSGGNLVRHYGNPFRDWEGGRSVKDRENFQIL